MMRCHGFLLLNANQLAVLFFMFEERRSEPDGKFVDLEMKDLSRDVMPEFVYGDHGEQNQDRQKHRTDHTHHA